MLVGGGFGGKEDVTVQHQAALIAYITKRAVKVKLTRKESILVHPKRHPMSIDLTTACDENGRLTAMKAVVVLIRELTHLLEGRCSREPVPMQQDRIIIR